MKNKWSFIIAGVIAAILIVRLIGGDESPDITQLSIEEGSETDKLVVILHAFTNNREKMRDVISVTRQALQDADILAPNYNSSAFANTSLARTAAQLDLEIQRVVENKKKSGGEYIDIILIGHSIGALLVRKSYLYSLGIGADHPLGFSRVKHTDWNQKVSRIILLAGMNRGWSTSNMSSYEKIRTWVGRVISYVTDKGKMVMSIERGTPFITNLKMDWIRAANNHRIEAQVIQILGKDDRVAPLDEHKELMATPNFIFIPLLEGATHPNIIDLLMDESGEAYDANRKLRKETFQAALTTPLRELKEKYSSNSSYLDMIEPNRKSVTHVVFVMHGIRDHGDWLESFKKELESVDPGVKAITSEYGYFPMARFLLSYERDKNVRWFVDQYTEALALYPNAKKFSFIGHSNGTYLLARALDNYYAMKFHRVYFAGSVVHSDYPWDTYITKTQRVGDFRNDIAIDDWVVAWFPKLYQLVNSKYDPQVDSFFNLGSGGFNGFTNLSGKKNVNFVTGGHSGALQEKHIPSIIGFITQDMVSATGSETEVRDKLNSVSLSALGISSNMAWAVWLILIFIIGGIGWLVVWIATVNTRIKKGTAIGIYAGLVLATIYSV